MAIRYYNTNKNDQDWSRTNWGLIPTGPFDLGPPGPTDTGDLNGVRVVADVDITCVQIQNTTAGGYLTVENTITINAAAAADTEGLIQITTNGELAFTGAVTSVDAWIFRNEGILILVGGMVGPTLNNTPTGTATIAGNLSVSGVDIEGIFNEGTLSLVGNVTGAAGGLGIRNEGIILSLVGAVEGLTGGIGILNEGEMDKPRGVITDFVGTVNGVGGTGIRNNGTITKWQCTGPSAGNYLNPPHTYMVDEDILLNEGGIVSETVLMNSTASVVFDTESSRPFKSAFGPAIVPAEADVEKDVIYDGGLKTGALVAAPAMLII